MSTHRLEDIDRVPLRTIAFGWEATLWDQLTGMQESLTRIAEHARGADLEAIALAWRKLIWSRFDKRYVPWIDVAQAALRHAFKGHGLRPPRIDEEALVVEVSRWPFFERHTALGRLGRRYRTAVLSQLDGYTLGTCMPGLARSIDHLIASDLSRTYKPAPAYFKLLGVQLGLPVPEALLVVSADVATDLEPARAQGFQTLRVRIDEDEPQADDDAPTLDEAIRFLG